ncbi:MAG: cyclic nucleotide-binding domain-containing protein [Spirochaetes bacterium]|nr:cyclic nucleotide-binding domain-containing protein [Spirochaetota bacterium]
MSRKVLKYSAGDTIISTGDNESRMYIIMNGNVQISLKEGTDNVVVANLKKHDFFGEMSLFRSKPRSADAVAMTDVLVTYVESVQQLNQFLVANPQFAAKMVHILVERLANTNELLIGKVSEVNRLKVYNEIPEEM